MTTGLDDRAPFSQQAVAVRVATAFVALSLATRLGFAALFHWIVSIPGLVLWNLLAVLVYLALIPVLRSGRVNAVILISGVEWAALSAWTVRLGLDSELYLFGLLLPVAVLVFVHLPIRLRVLLGAVPLVAFVVLRTSGIVPLSTGVLTEAELRGLATVNVVVFILLSTAITLFAVQMAEAARRRAEELAESRSRLIDDMSHELRTPAAILLTVAQAALERERDGASYRRSLEVIERQSRGLGRLVERMLELSRLERDEVSVDRSTPLGEAAGRIVEHYRELAATRGVRLDLETPSEATVDGRGEPREPRTDPTVLEIVLGNLLSNAIRFSPEGGRVEIRVEGGPAPRIRVRDEGPGIPPEELPRVFERYWRADKARSRRDDHHGLGLAIAQHYARALGAVLEAESVPGRGATFTIRWEPSRSPGSADSH